MVSADRSIRRSPFRLSSPPPPTPAPEPPTQWEYLWTPNHSGRRTARIKGVIIHTTRGGSTQEYAATLNWFKNPHSQASADYVLDGQVGHRIAQFNNAVYITWHAGEHNDEYIGIEIAQPTIDDPFTDWQYQAAAMLVADAAFIHRFVLTRANVFGHDESPQGIRTGKSDPGPLWDWDYFMSLLV